MNVVCVLKSGGLYTLDHVMRLEAMVSRHLTDYGDFVCVTDIPGNDSKVQWLKLAHNWTGWWSKLELFRGNLFVENTRILYFDLDTVIVGSLKEIAARKEPFRSDSR